jgi:hypothetical protein
LIVLIAISLGCGSNSGSQNDVEEKKVEMLEFESGDKVYYSGTAIEEDALKLGEYLTEIQYFGPSQEKPTAVWLDITNDIVYVKFSVIEDAWEDKELIEDAKEYALLISNEVFTERPVVLHICDEKWEVKKQLTPESLVE